LKASGRQHLGNHIGRQLGDNSDTTSGRQVKDIWETNVRQVVNDIWGVVGDNRGLWETTGRPLGGKVPRFFKGAKSGYRPRLRWKQGGRPSGRNIGARWETK